MDCRKDAGGGAPGRGRPRLHSEGERRRRVLDAAEAVFMCAGYHAATMDAVARHTGMSKKTIYQVFASKAELFQALLGDRLSPLTLPPTDDGHPLADQLVTLLSGMARFCLSPRQIALTRLMIAEAPQSHEMSNALERLGIGAGKGVLERWLDLQVERGTLPPLEMPQAANSLFFAAVGEALLWTLIGLGEPPTEAVLDQRIRYAVAMFLATLPRPLDAAPEAATSPVNRLTWDRNANSQ